MKRNMKIRFKTILLCGILMLLICSAASAAETAQVHIPILAQGADCTAELTDLLGNRLQLLELKKGIPGEFVIECTGLMRFSYSVRLIDADTGEEGKVSHSATHGYTDKYLSDLYKEAKASAESSESSSAEKEATKELMKIVSAMQRKRRPKPSAASME